MSTSDYTVTVNGLPSPIYAAQVLNFGPASYGQFDFEGLAHVVITCRHAVQSARLLPASFGLTHTLDGRTISFTLDRPRHVTVEVNGSFDRPLHLFSNLPEVDIPDRNDPCVLYFGPGEHELDSVNLCSGSVVYLAEGCILRAKASEPDSDGRIPYKSVFNLNGVSDIAIRGRGILHMASMPKHSGKAIEMENSAKILIEGIVIVDAPHWTIAMNCCHNITIRNVKQISARINSDGIDVSNSQDVLVEGCFLRCNDDEICVKTLCAQPSPESKRILVQDCVIWNDRARALGITSETRSNISDVTFRNCDIIRDFSTNDDCAALAVLVSDSGTMRNIRFEDIRIEHCTTRLALLWIGDDIWGQDETRGHIDGVTVKNITYSGDPTRPIVIQGFDDDHCVENVHIENLVVNGRAATDVQEAHVIANDYVGTVVVVGANCPE